VTWKGYRRQRVKWKDPHLEHLRTRADRGTFAHAAAICDPDHARRGPLGDVIDADQSGEIDAGVDLLHALARRGARGILVVVDEPAGQTP
jgi:hypothetical protein